VSIKLAANVLYMH